jgi:dihydroorotase
MLDFYHAGKISLERIVEKMCHAPAIAYKVQDRGFLDEGAWADMCVLDLDTEWRVEPENILYKCGWSPLTGRTMRGKVLSTIVSGHLAWHDGKFNEMKMGERLAFNR